jgi:hypothetical protein
MLLRFAELAVVELALRLEPALRVERLKRRCRSLLVHRAVSVTNLEIAR